MSIKQPESLYRYLANDENARACSDISEEACKEVPSNFLRILLSQFLTQTSDILLSAKVVLPWLLVSIGVPPFFTGLVVPIRESGSLIPQLVLGGYIRAYAIRKTFFVVGCVIQGCVALGIAWVCYALTGIQAGITIIGLMMISALGRGLCSIASKDVIGKTIPKHRRGILSGFSVTFSGLVIIAIGVALFFNVQQSTAMGLALVICAGVLLLLAALVYSQIQEYAGAQQGGKNGFRLALGELRLLKTDRTFRLFVITRALMMSSGLAAPFLVVMATSSSTAGLASIMGNLGTFIVLSGLASVISGNVWGRFADKNSQTLMQVTAAIAALLCLCASMAAYMELHLSIIAPILFFLLTINHQGVRLGRKTYIVNIASGNQRTTYVSVSNTLIGCLLLIVGVIGAVLAQFSLWLVLLVFGISCFSAFILSQQLPKA